ncbi:MAG: RDD family protein, partial [Thermoplasmata archaeon]
PSGWVGLGLPRWVAADHANLGALAESPHPAVEEARRGFRAAEQLVRIAEEAGRPSFGSLRQRAAAVGIDLLLVTAPAVALWGYLVLASPGSALELLGGVAFNSAVLGYVALAFLYFWLGEALGGVTLGKYLARLEVRERSLQRPGWISALLRNLPRILPLWLIGELGAAALAVLLKGGLASVPDSSPAISGFGAILLLVFAAVAVGIAGTVSLVVIQLTGGRERIGDLWGGTWVLRRPARTVRREPTEPVRAGSG